MNKIVKKDIINKNYLKRRYILPYLIILAKHVLLTLFYDLYICLFSLIEIQIKKLLSRHIENFIVNVAIYIAIIKFLLIALCFIFFVYFLFVL